MRPHRPTTALDTLHQPGFLLLWLSTGIYHSGHFLRGTIQSWLVLQLTNSSTWVGLVNGLPVVVTGPLSFFAGAITDRSDPRQMLLWTRGATGFLCFLTGFLISAQIIDAVQLLALATTLNAAYYLAFPANQVYIVGLVGPERLLTANALVNGFGFGINFVAPALAGYAAARLGIDSVYYALGLAYLVATVLILRTPPTPVEGTPSTGNLIRKVLIGIGFVRTQPGLAWVFYLALLSILGAPFSIILPAMTRDELGAGAAGFGLVVASQGVGSLAGTVALLAYGQLPRKGLAMLAGGVLWATGMIIIGLSQELWQAIAAGILMGFSPPLWMNSVQTVIITAVPAPMRARMAALFALSFQMVPAGYLLGGFLADALGPAASLQLLGLASLLAHVPPLFSRQFREIG